MAAGDGRGGGGGDDDIERVRSRLSSLSPSSPPSSSSSLLCAVCGKAGTKVCSRCKTVRYCSIGCQKRDWTNGGHKRACREKTKQQAAGGGGGSPRPAPETIGLGPLPASLRNEGDASRALHELWSIAAADADSKVAETRGQQKGQQQRSSRVEVVDDGRRNRSSSSKTNSTRITTNKSTPASIRGGTIAATAAAKAKAPASAPVASPRQRDSDSAVPSPPPPPESPATKATDRPRPNPPRDAEDDDAPRAASTATATARAASFVVEEMPQICRFRLALTLPPGDELLPPRHQNRDRSSGETIAVIDDDSITVSAEPLGRSRSRTLVTVRLRDRRADAAADTDSTTGTVLFAGEFPRPIEASEITWRVAPRTGTPRTDNHNDEAGAAKQPQPTTTTVLVFRLPYPYDPSNTGSLVLGGNLASSCSPSSAATPDEINAVVCGSCRLPLLGTAAPMTRTPTPAAQPPPRRQRTPIARVFPLPQGHWDEIADYLICYDGVSAGVLL